VENIWQFLRCAAWNTLVAEPGRFTSITTLGIGHNLNAVGIRSSPRPFWRKPADQLQGRRTTGGDEISRDGCTVSDQTSSAFKSVTEVIHELSEVGFPVA
jgi:hypothetical protein